MIIVTVFKTGLALEADLSKLTRQIQSKEHLGYNAACSEAEKRLNKVAYRQYINTEAEKLDLRDFGEHISQGAPCKVERA